MSEVPPAGGAALLDIGEDVGALVVQSSQSTAGQEVEIRRLGTEWAGEHSVVHRRALADGRNLYAAVFPGLHHGVYEVRIRSRSSIDEDSTQAVVNVRRAEVTEVCIAV